MMNHFFSFLSSWGGVALCRGLLTLEFLFGVCGGHRVGGRGTFLLHSGFIFFSVYLLFMLVLHWRREV